MHNQDVSGFVPLPDLQKNDVLSIRIGIRNMKPLTIREIRVIR